MKRYKSKVVGVRPFTHPEGRTVHLGVRIPIELRKRLQDWCKRAGVNQSQAVVEAVRRMVK